MTKKSALDDLIDISIKDDKLTFENDRYMELVDVFNLEPKTIICAIKWYIIAQNITTNQTKIYNLDAWWNKDGGDPEWGYTSWAARLQGQYLPVFSVKYEDDCLKLMAGTLLDDENEWNFDIKILEIFEK